MPFLRNNNRQSDAGSSEEAGQKRNPLRGLLSRKAPEPEEELPEMDVAGGVNRALRMTGNQTTSAEESDAVDIDHMRSALTSIEAALFAIDEVRDVIEQAYEVALSAQDVEDVAGRAMLAESYDELRLSINGHVENVDERAASLVGKIQRQLDVKLGGKAHYSVSPFRLDISPKGLNLSPPRDAFSTFEEITAILAELDNAIQKADRAASSYCRDAQFLIERMKMSDAAA